MASLDVLYRRADKTFIGQIKVNGYMYSLYATMNLESAMQGIPMNFDKALYD